MDDDQVYCIIALALREKKAKIDVSVNIEYFVSKIDYERWSPHGAFELVPISAGFHLD